MTSLLVAPTEPKEIKLLGQVSSMPERFGVDVMWTGKGVVCGAQRKEVKDFLQSVHDDRLVRELAQMQALDFRWLVLEGTFHWDRDGGLKKVKGFGYPWNRRQHWGYLASVQNRGVWVSETRDTMETCAWVESMVRWTGKDTHDATLRRGSPKGRWGEVGDEEWQVWLLQSFAGVGVALAQRIVRHFGGLPMKWEVGVEELMEVPGIGRKKAEQMWRMLG